MNIILILMAIILAIISGIIFYVFNCYIFSVVGQLLFVGNEVALSYNMFIYTGLITLCGVIIGCTYIIVKKINNIYKN